MDDQMDATEATQIIAGVMEYEEGMTAKVAGIALMFWGCLTFGLFFVSYAAAAGGSEIPPSIGILVFMGLITAGIAATNRLWRWRALHAGEKHHAWRIWGPGIVVAVGGLIAMSMFDPLIAVDSSVSLAVVATAILVLIGIRLHGADWQRIPWLLVAAGILLVIDVALLIWAPSRLPEPSGWAHLLAASSTAAALFAPGYLYFSRG